MLDYLHNHKDFADLIKILADECKKSFMSIKLIDRLFLKTDLLHLIR